MIYSLPVRRKLHYLPASHIALYGLTSFQHVFRLRIYIKRDHTIQKISSRKTPGRRFNYILQCFPMTPKGLFEHLKRTFDIGLSVSLIGAY